MENMVYTWSFFIDSHIAIFHLEKTSQIFRLWVETA
jgi:hypothetical protein